MIDPVLGERLAALPPAIYSVGYSTFQVFEIPGTGGRKGVRDITGYPIGDGLDLHPSVQPNPAPPGPPPHKGVFGWLHRTFDPMLKSKFVRIAAGVLSAGVGVFGGLLAISSFGHLGHGGALPFIGGAALAGVGATGLYVTASYKPPPSV